jgi:hypothetical protein
MPPSTMIKRADPNLQAAQAEKALATHEQSSVKLQVIAVACSRTMLVPDVRTGRQRLFYPCLPLELDQRYS